MTTQIYGASDDLIELDGDIRDELDAYEKRILLTFDSGARLTIEYDRDRDGVWRIEDKSLVPGAVVLIPCEQRTGYEGPDGPVYSDLAITHGATKFTSQEVDR